MVCCQEQHRAELTQYLSQNIHFNIFILSDIQQYGFSNPNQQVFMLPGSDGCIQGVCLRYYRNLLLTGKLPPPDALHSWVATGVHTIMGEADLIQQVGACLGDVGVYQEKRLLAQEKEWKGRGEVLPVRMASVQDIDRIHAFLMTIPGFQQLYGEKEMIYNRIVSGEGTHLYYEKDGKIIAHVNSAAATSQACMLGGLAVAPAYQARGLGTAMVSALCQRMVQQNRQIHVFTDCTSEYSLFDVLGFREIGKWGVISISG